VEKKKTPGTNFKGGWSVPKPVMDILKKKKPIIGCRGSNPGQTAVPTPTITAQGGTKYIVKIGQTLTFVKYEEV
jgi:hypothetical protein